MKVPQLRRIAETALITGALTVVSCYSNVERVPVVSYTEGVETRLEEVAPNDWRIADEQVLADTAATRVIAQGLNGVVDTFAYDELTAANQVAAAPGDTTKQRRQRRFGFFGPILLYGLIGNRLGAGRSGITPNASVYKNQQTFNRVQNGAGSRLNSTARRTTVTRPSTGRKGFGSGARSGRSYGG